jgi:hypothetical protein
MKEKITAYFDGLEKLSTEELDRSTKGLVLRERKNLACVTHPHERDHVLI